MSRRILHMKGRETKQQPSTTRQADCSAVLPSFSLFPMSNPVQGQILQRAFLRLRKKRPWPLLIEPVAFFNTVALVLTFPVTQGIFTLVGNLSPFRLLRRMTNGPSNARQGKTGKTERKGESVAVTEIAPQKHLSRGSKIERERVGSRKRETK